MDKKSIETEFLIAISPLSGDKWQSKSLFLEIFDTLLLIGRALDSRLRGRGFEPHWRHCVVSLSKNINPSLVLVQPRKTGHFITESLVMGR